MNKLQNFKPRNKQAGFLQFLPLIMGGLSLLSSKKAPKQQTTTQGGSSVSSSTSSMQLPGELTGAANYALGQAGNLYGQGQSVAPISDQISLAANRLRNPGVNASPTSSVFAGGATINPYLDQMFNVAADATQNRSATEFAHAGRLNSGSHQQARSQELQRLAAGIYGPGFEAERARQFGAAEAGIDRTLGQSEANINRELSTASPLIGLGQYLQQDTQARMNAPFDTLNNYINQLGALGQFFPGTTTQTQVTDQTGQVTQPLYNNPFSAFAGGAMLGGALQPLMTGMGNRQPPTSDNFINPYGNPYSPWAMSSMYG